MSNLFYCIQYHIGNPKSAVSLLELHLLHVLFCFFEKTLFKIYALKIGILLPFRGINILFQIISKHKRKYSNLFTILVPFNYLAFDKTLYRLPAERILIVYWDVSVSNPHRSQLSHRNFGNYQTSRGTQFNFTLCESPIKTIHYLTAIKYIIDQLQLTFPLSIKHILTLYPSKSSLIQINHRHFRKLSELWRNTIQSDTLRFIYQNTSHL